MRLNKYLYPLNKSYQTNTKYHKILHRVCNVGYIIIHKVWDLSFKIYKCWIQLYI